MASNMNIMKSPPEFQESRPYESYKKEIQIWRLLKVCSSKEEGPMLFRTLSGKAKEAVLELSVEEIGSDDGLNLILKKLDRLYLSDKNQRIFSAVESFEHYKRPDNMEMAAFILEFEKLHGKIKEFECVYPDAVLGYKILKAAKLSSENEKLLKATIKTGEWSFQSVVEQLQKIYSNVSSGEFDSLPIKTEAILHATDMSRSSSAGLNYEDLQYYDENHFEVGEQVFYAPNRKNAYQFRRPARNYPQSRFQNHRGGNSEFMQRNTYDNKNGNATRMQPRYFNRGYTNNSFQLNPKDNRGNLSKCRKCRSVYHWIEHCPHATQQEKVNGVNNAFFSNEIENSWRSQSEQSGIKSTNDLYDSHEAYVDMVPYEGNFGEENIYSTNNTFFLNNRETGINATSNETLRTGINDDVYIGLYQSTNPTSSDQLISLVGETLNHAIIDSGCTKTVCGKEWFDLFKESLTKQQQSMIKCEASTALFSFGDSTPVTTLFKVTLPVQLKGRFIHLVTEVVPSNVPLLLSKSTLKEAKAKINFEVDRINMFGFDQPMLCTSSGHYAIPIKYMDEKSRNEQLADIILLSVGDKEDIRHTAKKLHIQFSHASASRVIKLLKDAGNDDTELFDEVKRIEEQCTTCKRYKKTPRRPIVAFPLATNFNDVVALDLKTFKNNQVYFLHIIDHATRFSAASVIYSKKKEVIVSEFFKIWISVYGRPLKVLVDNGGEFINSDFIDLCENMNIRIMTTAAESAWSNGLCEKYNGVIGEAVKKVIEDVGCSVDIALAWSVNAKNSLHNIHGFSPYQMVFGQNPNLPLSFSNKLPALEGRSSSQIVRDHLNALHKSRQEFVRLESCEKLSRALRRQTRTHNNERYFTGDLVFYKRDKEEKWKGPVKVIIQEGSKVLLKTIGGMVSVHTCRLQHAGEDTASKIGTGTNSGIKESENSNDEILSSNYEEFGNNNGGNVQHDVEMQEVEVDTSIHSIVETAEDTLEGEVLQTENQNGGIDDAPQSFNNEMLLQSKDLPKANQHITYRSFDSDEWKNVKIMSRAGKASAANKFWLNIKNMDNDLESSIDWKENVAEWKLLEYNTLFANNKEEGFEAAKLCELNNWKDLDVYVEIEDNNHSTISVRWVLTQKKKDGKEYKKARLVARGFEESNENIQKESPTCHKESLRIVIVIIASLNWEIRSLDIKSAFLQGSVLQREVYLKPPREAGVKGKIWKLNRCVYGLVDASRYWYLRVRDELAKMGCIVSKLDPAVFFYYTCKLEGILISHVDDFLFAGTDEFHKNVVDKLKSVFKISSECSMIFKYIGITVRQDKSGIYVNQLEYSEELREISIESKRKKIKSLTVSDEEKNTLRSVIGQLNWLCTQTRPDLAYEVCDLSNSFKIATVETLIKANKTIRKAKQEQVTLFFPKMDLNNIELVCYTDASFGNLPDGGSQGGMYIELRSGEKKAPLFWQSKRIKRTVKSTMAAESLALIEGIESAILLREFISEILFANCYNTPVEVITDNKSVHDAAYSTNQILDKGMRINMSILREFISRKEIILKWVSSKMQVADVFTKRGCDSTCILKTVSCGGKTLF